MKVPSLRGRKGRPDSQTNAAHPPKRQQQLPQAEAGKITPERQIVEKLQTILAEVDSMALPVGQLGGEFLDALKLVERISEKIFAKARELLKRDPATIPGWQVNDVPTRRITKDAAEIFRTLSEADGSLTPEEFMTACSIGLSAIHKLLAERNPLWDPAEIEREINHVLSEVIRIELVTKLLRVKERQLDLSLGQEER